MQLIFTKPWLHAFSGLSINLSAGWLLAAFIGPNVSFPENLKQFIVLTVHVGFAIVCLLLTVWLEKELEK
jgi:hypothetical protein